MKNARYRDMIWALIEPAVASAAFEVVEVECMRGRSRWLVRLYIDSGTGVTVDDCARISNEVGDILSVHDVPPGPYDLEVSSPGLDRPLTRDKDFLAYRGRNVKIRAAESIEGRRNFRGRLVDYVDEDGEKTLIVDVDGKHYRIPRQAVDRANLQYEL